MTDKLNAKKVALSLASVSAILYTACALLVAIAPGFAIKLFSNLFHGVDITGLAGKSISIAGALVGLIEVAVYAWIAGWLFAWVYNKFK